MRRLIKITKYLLLLLAWFMSALLVVCAISYWISNQHNYVTLNFLKQFTIMLAVVLVAWYIFKRAADRYEY